MSRIGREPVVISDGVKVQLQGDVISVEGSKGKLNITLPENISVEIKDGAVVVTRTSELKTVRSLHGTIRALINNLIVGVNVGFKKELDIVGVGYKAQVKGESLALNMGFSHPVEMKVPQGLKVSTTSATHIVIEGIDKQKVGQFAANVREIYPPEPYKGKGIRYTGEEVRKKLGKALAK
ncbi:MAG: 50S ribosomal protein L6 [Candidatus Omnitrophica bacterium]|nr:50S ribosomal protein L6 [Candidatus Omnitrophota bacterium]